MNGKKEEMLRVSHLQCGYGTQPVVQDVSFSVCSGEWFMIAGPNGAGKSTIINAISRAIPCRGEILCMGRNINTFRPHELAGKIGVLSQNHYAGYGFSVREVVGLGRYAYRQHLWDSDPAFEEKVQQALEMTGMTDLAEKSILALSGGELQRTFLAQLFAQDPAIMLLDEPSNHLDLVYQKQLFALLEEWLRQPGRCVISVIHDLSAARRYGSHGLLVRDGRQVHAGTATETFSRANLEAAFSLDVYAWMQQMYSVWTDRT